MIPDIGHHNQNAYVKGKSIFDAVRVIDDILEFTEREKIQGLVVAIDFKKAFDSVNRNFMLETLSAFNFGPTLRWIRAFHQNITSSAMNNVFRQVLLTYVEVLDRVTLYHRTCLLSV